MPKFISLVNWTDQGVRNFKGSVDRAGAVGQLAEKLGGKMTDIFWTIGPYDVVAISEFPDDETGEAFLLSVGAQGNVRTTTLRAFDAEEMTRIIGKAAG
jgi:uncharacterized protein with GYD domain